MRPGTKYLFIVGACILVSYVQAQSRYITSRGEISFTSEAPLEVIKAQSKELKGAIDADKKTFAFTVPVKSFEGFNSPLQREHFNENYMESTQYDKATFNGKIIEQIDFTKDGEYEVRAKGKLNVHGIEQERIIKATISTKDGKLSVHSIFTVLLEEHGIAIPKIVYQKIADEIQLKVVAVFTMQGR